MNSLEAFYREKLAENDKVSHLDRSPFSNSPSLVQLEDVIVTKKAVVELTTETFVPSTEQGFAFVVFFAPWCKHCQVLKPVFQELAKQMIQTSRLTLATVSSIRSNRHRWFSLSLRSIARRKRVFVQNTRSKVIQP